MKQKLKPLPHFKNEDEEFEFWSTHDTLDYFDSSTSRHIDFPNLKKTTDEELQRLGSKYSILKPQTEKYAFMIHDTPRKEKRK